MLPFYFMLSWTPKVLVDEGLSLGSGISGSVVLNAAGIVGGLLLGLGARIFGLKRITSACMVLFALAVMAFGAYSVDLVSTLILAMVVGFFMIGVIVGLYAVIAAMYPVRVRNTGTGLALGIGRIGGILGPILGGVLIQAGWSRPAYCFALAAPTLIAAALILWVPLLIDASKAETKP